MNALLFVLFLQFPTGCPCLQVPYGANLEPFEHTAVELFATVESQVQNEGIYGVRGVLFWPYGIAVVVLDREPPVPGDRFYLYGVVPAGPKRLVFRDGFEAGTLAGWDRAIGGPPP